MIKIGIECENIEDRGSQWGIGRMVYNLIREYTLSSELQNNFRLYLYFKNEIPDDPIFQHKSLNIRLIGTKSFNIFYHILMPIRALRDTLDCMFFPAYMLPPLYFKKSITLLTNDVFYEYTKGNLPFKYKLAYRLFSNWAAIKSWKILAISEYSKNEIHRLFNIKLSRIFVSRLGVNSIDRFESDYSLVPDYRYMLTIGQMFPRRRAKEIIDAFHKLAHKYSNINLYIVGKDKYNPPIVRKMIDHINNSFGVERIKWIEYIEDNSKLKGLIEKSEALIYVSSSEAFGLPPAEAAYLGRPIIVKNNDLNKELFGSGAYMVDNEKDSEDILNQMISAIENKDGRNEIARDNISVNTWTKFTNNFFKYINENIQ